MDKTSGPKVSIIIPVHKPEPYFADCLESVMSQQWNGETEVIIVDDGGDSLLDVYLRAVPDHARIKVVRQEHRGVSAARNNGIRHSAGRFIMFVDADDMLLPGALHLLSEIIEHSGTRIAVTPLARKRHGRQADGNPDFSSMDGRDAAVKMLYQTDRCISASVCGKLFDRRIFEKHIFDENTRYEDIDVMFRIFMDEPRIAVIDKNVYFYRKNRAGFTHVWSPERADALKVTKRIAGYCSASENAELTDASIDRHISACFNYLSSCPDRLDEYKGYCKEYIRQHRGHDLRNRHIRVKNRLCLFLSYLNFFPRRITLK